MDGPNYCTRPDCASPEKAGLRVKSELQIKWGFEEILR